MSDTDATGLWPKKDTLAAGDEDKLSAFELKQRSGYQEDGDLAVLAKEEDA